MNDDFGSSPAPPRRRPQPMSNEEVEAQLKAIQEQKFLDSIREGDALELKQLVRLPFSGNGLKTWAVHPLRFIPWAGLIFGGGILVAFVGTLITGRPAQVRSMAELTSPLTLGAILASPVRSTVISVDQNVIAPMDNGFGKGGINWAQPQHGSDPSLVTPPVRRIDQPTAPGQP